MNLSDLIGAVISKNHRKERDCRKEQMVGLLFVHCFSNIWKNRVSKLVCNVPAPLKTNKQTKNQQQPPHNPNPIRTLWKHLKRWLVAVTVFDKTWQINIISSYNRITSHLAMGEVPDVFWPWQGCWRCHRWCQSQVSARDFWTLLRLPPKLWKQ